MVGTYEALLWLCEWSLGEQRGKRAKGKQIGSLNSLFHRFEALFKDLGPFQGFGAFSGIRDLFGDLGPFSGIRALFRGFGAFFGDSGPFSGIRGLFRGFAAFSRIRSLFADLQPFHRFTDSRPTKGAKGANEPPGETFAT